MSRVMVIDRCGEVRAVDLTGQGSLMLALRHDHGFEIAGACGGCCICATCHVRFDSAALAALPAPAEEERELIEQLQHHCHRSRLACQVDRLVVPDGAFIEIAPEE